MRTWAIFFYGLSAGLTLAWVLSAFLFDASDDFRWFAVAASAGLLVALVLHQRSTRLDSGRRWRRTQSGR